MLESRFASGRRGANQYVSMYAIAETSGTSFCKLPRNPRTLLFTINHDSYGDTHVWSQYNQSAFSAVFLGQFVRRHEHAFRLQLWLVREGKGGSRHNKLGKRAPSNALNYQICSVSHHHCSFHAVE